MLPRLRRLRKSKGLELLTPTRTGGGQDAIPNRLNGQGRLCHCLPQKRLTVLCEEQVQHRNPQSLRDGGEGGRERMDLFLRPSTVHSQRELKLTDCPFYGCHKHTVFVDFFLNGAGDFRHFKYLPNFGANASIPQEERASTLTNLAPMLQKILERELASGFASLPGTYLRGTLPVPSALLNQALREALAQKSGPVKGVLIALLDDNKAIAVVAIEQWPLPKQVELPFTIAPVVAKNGKLIAAITLDKLEGIIGMLIPLLAGLVPGVKANGNTLEIDLGAQLKEKSGHDFTPLIEKLEIRTRRSFLDIAFALRVPETEVAK